jgi:hypothetical protein
MKPEITVDDPFANLDQATIERMSRLRDQDGLDLSTPPEVESLQAELKQANALKDKAIAQIAVLKAKSGGGTHFNPDGSMTLSVTIDQDTVLAMTQYQEFEGTSIEETLQKHIPLALEAYI